MGNVHEDGRAPAHPIDDFKNGYQVGGNTVPTGEGFSPVDLLENVDEVPNVVDSSSIGKGRAPTTNTTNSLVERQRTSRGFGVGLPAPQTDNRLLLHGRKEEEGNTLTEKSDAHGQQLLVLHGAWLRGAVLDARASVPWLRGTALEAQFPVAGMVP